MKKISLIVIILTFLSSFSASAQTTAGNIMAKLDFSPANEYGVKRVNYGTWDTSANAKHVWAIFTKKEGYILYISSEGFYGRGVYSIDMVARWQEANKILEEMDLKKWTKVIW